MREHASEPRDYEMMVVVTPTVAEEGLPAAIERVSGYITTQGGTVSSTIHENPWGRRRLAYQINDHRDAFYVLYRFIARPEMIVEIEREIKLDEAIIRYLVVRYDEMTEHEERAPRQPAEGPGGPSFRRSRPEAQAPAETPAPAATPEAPAANAAPAAEADIASETEPEASQPPVATDEPESADGDAEAVAESAEEEQG